MASNYFLKLDGITGESTTTGHEGAIELESWSMSVSEGSGGSSQEFTFAKRTGPASSALMLACASGQGIAKAVLTVEREMDGKIRVILRYTFTSLLVRSANIGGGVDSFTLSYETVSKM